VSEHLESCRSCGAELLVLGRVTEGLATLAEREAVPPPYLADAIVEAVAEPLPRRTILVPPLLPEVARAIGENREALASAAGAAALVAAGAAYAFWRTRRTRRTGLQSGLTG